MKLVDMTVEKYMIELGSNSPAPGGGSASAICGAQGAALTAMVAGLTMGKKKYEEHQALCTQVGADAAKHQELFLEQVDKDTQAFLVLSDAFKLPKENDEQKKARSAAIQEGTLLATQVPFDTMKLALAAMKLTHRLVGKSNASAASDLGVAALNLQSCCGGAWLNVLINLGSLKDEEAVSRFKDEGQSILKEADALSREIYTRISESL